MASKAKALTKEVRGIVSSKTSAARKRLAEANTMEKLVAGGVSPVGAAAAAACDAYDLGIPVGDKGNKIPLSPFGAIAGIGLGALVKGTAGAALFGFGVGQLDGFTYKMVLGALSDNEADVG